MGAKHLNSGHLRLRTLISNIFTDNCVVVWAKAAIKEIFNTTVTNCFISCGFPIPDMVRRVAERATNSEELAELVNSIFPSCKENYADIDAEL